MLDLIVIIGTGFFILLSFILHNANNEGLAFKILIITLLTAVTYWFVKSIKYF